MATPLASPHDTPQPGLNDLKVEQHLPKTQPLFTWELPEHQQCEHRAGPVSAVSANGRKLVFCLDCNLLVALAKFAKKPTTRTASTIEAV